MTAIVDKEKCIGCGLCADICPQVFAMTEDGNAEVITDLILPGAAASCRQAEEQCPVEAISVFE
jgi:ferredoxin